MSHGEPLMNRSVSGLSGLPIFRCFQLTCFRTHQFRSHTPLLSILYPRPYHRFFTGYVFSKECKKDSCVPGRRFHHHADCAEALVFSLFEVDYVFFLDIKTTVSTCHQDDCLNMPRDTIMNVHSTSELTNQSASNRRNLLFFVS